MTCDNWQTTAQMFSSLFERPKMSEKLLTKPPFKYIFDIITETTKATGFAQGLYEEDELNAQYYDNRDKKLLYLKKMQDLVQLMLKEEIAARPNKIVAGLEPNNTNLFLQAIYRAAVSLENSQPFVKKVLAKLESGGGGTEEEPQQEQPKQEPKQEAKKPAEEKKPKKKPPVEEEQIKQPPQEEKPPEKKVKPKKKQEEEPQQQQEQPTQQNLEPPKQKLQRPGTASKRPPKVTSNVKVEETPQKGGKGTQGVIMEGGQDEPDNDEQPPMEQQQQRNMGDIDTQNRGKFIQDAMKGDEVEEQQQQQSQQQAEEGDGGPKIKMGRLGGKKKKKGTSNNETSNQGGTISSGGNAGLSQGTDVETLTKLVQGICQNANPLGKSLEFINDDIESMNHELEYWQKQYKASKDKMSNELKVTEEALQPLHDKLSEIDLQIFDQKAKIQNMKAQIIKNQSQIQTLLYSVVTNK